MPPIADAFVRVRPDTRQFRAQLQTQINAAVAGLTIPPVGAGAAGAAGGVGALGAASGRASRGVRQLSQESNALRGVLIGISRVTPVTVFGLGLAGTAGIAAATAFRTAVAAAASFEQQLNVFRVVADASADEMERVSELAKELGADITLPATSALDAANAMTELAKAGIDVNNVLGGTRGVLQLAAAAQIDEAEAAKIAASALNAFNLEGEDTVKVADLLAASSIAAQGEITDMAAALQQSAAVARQAGISIEDTITAISLLAQAGLQGSDAGTSLRTTILRLTPTTKQAAEFVHALGISFSDAEGRLRPLPDIFEQYRIQLGKLPPVLQQTALAQIFGQDAIRAASILARGGAKDFAAMSEEVERSGVAAELAGARTQGFSGQLSALASNSETLATNIGQLLLPVLGLLVGILNDLVDLLNSIPDAVSDMKSDLEAAFEGTDDFAEGIPVIEQAWDAAKIAGKAFAKDTEVSLKLANDAVENLANTLFQLEKPPEDAGKIIQKTARDINDVFADLAKAGGGSSALNEAALALQNIIAQLRDAGPVSEQVAGQVARLLESLQERELSGGRRPVILRRPAALEIFLDPRQVETALGEASRELSRMPLDLFPKVTPDFNIDDAMRNSLNELGALVPLAKDQGRLIGKGVSDGVDETLTSQMRDVINSAKQNLLSIGSDFAASIGELIDAGPLTRQIEQMEDALTGRRRRRQRAAIVEDLEEARLEVQRALLETGPLAKKIEELQEKLDFSKDRERRRTLIVDLRDAKDALKEAQESIGGIGPLDAEQRRAINRFLGPFREDVKRTAAELQQSKLEERITKLQERLAAKEAALAQDPLVVARRNVARLQEELKDFDTEAVIDELKNTAEQQKKTVEQGLQDIITAYNQGAIDLQTANRRINQLLRRSGAADWRQTAAELGAAFRAEILAQFRALQAQAKQIQIAPSIPGAGIAPNIVTPASDITQMRKDTERTADNTDALPKILRILRGPGGANNLNQSPQRPPRPQASPPASENTAGTGNP